MTKNKRSSTIDANTLIMSKNTLKTISESTNQMIVNSITSTKSVASQNASIKQGIKIKIKGVAGDVTVKNIKNDAKIEMTNVAEITFSAFDNVRTDLANSVLQSFKTNTNQESMNTLSANLETSLANQTSAAIDLKSSTKINQQQETQMPMATAGTIAMPNTTANVKLDQTTVVDTEEATFLNQNYTNDMSIDRIMETHVNNAVTQNFTKESLSQLSQVLMLEQDIEIDIEGVGGNVSVEDISNVTNVVLRQTLSNTMNVGNSIANAVVNTMGIGTDDTQTTKNVSSAGLTSKTDLRNGLSSDSKITMENEYTQKITQDFGFGSCGSSMSSCISCIVCIICILSCGLGAAASAMPSGSESSETIITTSEPSEKSETSDTPSDNVGTSVGGYYYFD